MNTNKIAKIIAGTRQLSFQYHQSVFYTDMLIDALADYFEAELGNECDAMGCDEEGHRGGHTWTFIRAEFLCIATAGA